MWNYNGYGNMMGWGGGFGGFLCVFTWLVYLAVGILLVVYLWQKIKK